MLKVYTFFSRENNDVIYAIASSYEEAFAFLKQRLIGDDDTYVIGSSAPCIAGSYGSITIV